MAKTLPSVSRNKQGFRGSWLKWTNEPELLHYSYIS